MQALTLTLLSINEPVWVALSVAGKHCDLPTATPIYYRRWLRLAL